MGGAVCIIIIIGAGLGNTVWCGQYLCSANTAGKLLRTVFSSKKSAKRSPNKSGFHAVFILSYRDVFFLVIEVSTVCQDYPKEFSHTSQSCREITKQGKIFTVCVVVAKKW